MLGKHHGCTGPSSTKGKPYVHTPCGAYGLPATSQMSRSESVADVGHRRLDYPFLHRFRDPETSMRCWGNHRTLWNWMRMIGTPACTTIASVLVLKLTIWPSYNISYPHYLGAKYDAATTNLSYEIPADTSDVAPVEITLSFLTPITPTSTLRQSIPAGYISVHVKGSFDINVYIDINGNWVSGDSTSRIAWDLACSPMKAGAEPGPLVKSWRLKKETEQLFSEQHDQAEWGTLHFTADGVCIRRAVAW